VAGSADDEAAIELGELLDGLAQVGIVEMEEFQRMSSKLVPG
jgi:hypothetical protein